jgi:hypothetical protein
MAANGAWGGEGAASAHLPGDEIGEGSWCSGTGAGTLADRAARAAELAARETLVKGLGVEVRPAAQILKASNTTLTLQVPSQHSEHPTCTLPR